jgi:broad specificity phosphatase PhoE
MRIVLLRHARVLVEWKRHYNSSDYDAENAHYDRAPVEASRPIEIPIRKVYVSTLPRSAATAAFLTGEKEVVVTSLLDEVPIRSFMDSELRLPTWFWNILATLQWHRGSGRQHEDREETDRRIDAFLDLVEARGEDCIAVGHGIQFYEMMKRMKARGYEGRAKKYLRNSETREFSVALPRIPTAKGMTK